MRTNCSPLDLYRSDGSAHLLGSIRDYLAGAGWCCSASAGLLGATLWQRRKCRAGDQAGSGQCQRASAAESGWLVIVSVGIIACSAHTLASSQSLD